MTDDNDLNQGSLGRWKWRWLKVLAYLVLLRFTLLRVAGIVFFTYWRFVATLHGANLLVLFFQQHLPTCISLSCFGNSWNISNSFIVICNGDLWPVIFSTIEIVLGHHKLPYKMKNLIDKCIFWLLHLPTVLRFSPSSWASLFPETQQYWNKAN